ncbi:MAG: helicase-related protein, partial [Streptosporangiaceae bacterium]
MQARGREWVVLPQSEPPRFLVLRPLGGGDDEVAGVFPALEQVSSATFDAPDPGDVGTAVSAGLLRTALRIGFRASAGPFRSLARLAVEPRAYQLVPLLMALRQETVRLLIADDVGIGKTIEAGLTAAELLEQGDATGLAVLCGPALAEQWQRELATKFGIHAELVLPGTIRRLERGLLQGETLFDRFRHIVVSADFIKRPGLREQFWHGCPDLLIVDEAHTCVSDGSGGRSRMLRHELVKGLAKDPRRHLILVTATPHSGKEEGFRNLLALLSQNLEFVDLESVPGRERLARHFVQRRRADIRSYLDESTPFPEDRLTQERPYSLYPAYKELFDDVLQYARETVRDPAGGQLRQRVRYWSALALLRALASTPRAAAATLRTRAANLDAEDVAEADRLGRSAVLDLPDEETVESADATPGADADAADGDTAQRRRLKRFAARAADLEGAGDAKLALLAEVVKELLLEGFNPIVFCRFIDTAEYVAEHLAHRLGSGYAVAAVTGVLPPDEREARIRELTADQARRPVLIATDCLSEGVNLQESFQAVVHYD